MEIDLAGRLTGIKIANRSFTPEGQAHPVQYRRLVLVGIINGNVKEIDVPVNRDKLDLIEALTGSEDYLADSKK